MSYKVPQINGLISITGVFIQLVVISLLVWVTGVQFEDFSTKFLIAAIIHAFVARTLRSTIAAEHRKGIRMVLQKKFAEAIPHFENSLHFFQKNPRIDKLRAFTLLSATGISYTQMALDNLGFAYSQTGDREKAIMYYSRSVKMNPKDGNAQTALKMLSAVSAESHQPA